MNSQNSYNLSIDLEKLTAETLNGYFAIFGCIDLVGAYWTNGRIIPCSV